MNGKVEVRVQRVFRARPESIYSLWLDARPVREWMANALRSMGLSGEMCRVEIDARVGGAFHFSDRRGQLEARHWGTYLELDPPRAIAFTWIVDESEEADPSRVRLTMEPAEDGCVVALVHVMDAKWADYIEQTAAGWGRILAAVGAMAETAAHH